MKRPLQKEVLLVTITDKIFRLLQGLIVLPTNPAIGKQGPPRQVSVAEIVPTNHHLLVPDLPYDFSDKVFRPPMGATRGAHINFKGQGGEETLPSMW